MTPAEAFAVIPLAAAAADNCLQPEEATLLYQQLRGHSPYREMAPVAFGTMSSTILLELGERRCGLVEEAASLLSIQEQEKAFAFAARIVHADRIATKEESLHLAEVGSLLSISPERLSQIGASFVLLRHESPRGLA